MEKSTIVKIIVLVTAILGLYYVITLYQRKQINETNGENEEFNVQEEKPDSDENVPVKASDGSNEVFLDLDEDKPNDTFGLGGNQYPKDLDQYYTNYRIKHNL